MSVPRLSALVDVTPDTFAHATRPSIDQSWKNKRNLSLFRCTLHQFVRWNRNFQILKTFKTKAVGHCSWIKTILFFPTDMVQQNRRIEVWKDSGHAIGVDSTTVALTFNKKSKTCCQTQLKNTNGVHFDYFLVFRSLAWLVLGYLGQNTHSTVSRSTTYANGQP